MSLTRNRCLLLLVDGLRPDVGEAMLAAGDLPHLSSMLERGGRSRAITVFPSTTSVAYLPFLTGCTPGRCNIPSIRWLDRRTYQGRWWRDREAIRSYCGYQAPRLDGDIAPDVSTIFELVPESVGIFTPIARGLTPARDPSRLERQLWGSVAHFALWHQPSDDAVSRHLLRAVDQGRRFVFAQFPAVDGYTHQTTPDAEPVRRALRKVDATVGAVRERLAERGELESTLMLVVSDHGATVVRSHLDLANWFRARGIPTLSHPVIWERNPRAAVMVAGNGSAMVSRGRTSPGIVGGPWSGSGARRRSARTTDVIATTAAGTLGRFGSGRRARMVGSGSGKPERGARACPRSAAGVTYQPRSTGTLSTSAAPRTATMRAWLEATWDAQFPDAVFHLMDQFRAGRTGDLVVVALRGIRLQGAIRDPGAQGGTRQSDPGPHADTDMGERGVA